MIDFETKIYGQWHHFVQEGNRLIETVSDEAQTPEGKELEKAMCELEALAKEFA